jgi:hypothetical protein
VGIACFENLATIVAGVASSIGRAATEVCAHEAALIVIGRISLIRDLRLLRKLRSGEEKHALSTAVALTNAMPSGWYRSPYKPSVALS